MSYDPYSPGDGPGGYQPLSGGGRVPDQWRGQAPKSVINAVWLMFAGAAVTTIGVIVALTSTGSLRPTIKADNPGFSASQVNVTANIYIATIVVVGLIGVGLWIWMAFMNKAGKNWARITGTVFFGIATIILLTSFARAGFDGSRIITVIVWLIGLATVILLWRNESSEFFKGQSERPW
jgi:hypothetical protein